MMLSKQMMRLSARPQAQLRPAAAQMRQRVAMRVRGVREPITLLWLPLVAGLARLQGAPTKPTASQPPPPPRPQSGTPKTGFHTVEDALREEAISLFFDQELQATPTTGGAPRPPAAAALLVGPRPAAPGTCSGDHSVTRTPPRLAQA
jgi:hypothetical protein